MLEKTLNCVGPGYDYGNGPTSAQGWAGCKGATDTILAGNSSIAQTNTVLFTKTSTGDSAALAYVYSAAFGGFVDASGEQVTPLVIHMDQLGWYSGTLSNGGGGTLGTGGNTPTGAITIAPFPIRYAGTVTSVTVVSNHVPIYGGPATLAIERQTGASTWQTVAVTPITMAAGDGSPQTFTTSMAAQPQDRVAIYIPPSGTGVTEGDADLTLYVSSAPTVGFTGTFATRSFGATLEFTMAPVGTGATTIVADGFNCIVSCTQNPRAGDLFPDGGILIDSQTSTTNTITGQNVSMGLYTVTVSGTAPTTSYAWGTVIPSSCTHNSGKWKIYAAQTCNVTLATSPATPNPFQASTTMHACLVGPWYEEVEITAAPAASGGVQSITFNSFQSWDGTDPSVIMQGGICGQALVQTSTVGSWPGAYQEVGYDGTNLYYASCLGGACNPPYNQFPNGTGITNYPMATIIGTLNGLPGGAQLATNSIPFNVGDSLFSAPSSAYYGTGFNLYTSQHMAGSNGIRVVDSGPTALTAAYTAINTGTQGNYALYTSGNYSGELFANYRPVSGACGVLCMQGNTFDGVHAYNIFTDTANGSTSGQGGSFIYDPTATTGGFSLTRSLTTPTLTSTSTLSSTSTGFSSVLLGGAQPLPYPFIGDGDETTVIGTAPGAYHTVGLVNYTLNDARNTLSLYANIAGTLTPLAEIGSGQGSSTCGDYYTAMFSSGGWYPFYAACTGQFVGINNLSPTHTLDVSGTINASGTATMAAYATNTNCSSTSSPATCGSAAAGTVQLAASATTLTINTTAVTASSEFGCLTYNANGITAPTNIGSLTPPYVSSITAGTSFTLTFPVAPATNPINIGYCLVN